MLREKPRFNDDISRYLADKILSSSPAQLSPIIRDEAVRYFAKKDSLVNHYWFFDGISRTSVKKVSPEIRRVCDVRKNYILE